MANEPFPYLVLEGTPYEIGLSHGEQGKDKIRTAVDYYRGMFRDYSGIDWDTACRYALTFVPAVEKYDRDIMEEIRGIADGSGFDLAEILALNVRSEIVVQGSQVTAALNGGCTSCAVMPRRSANGHTILAQNWDWKKDAGNTLVVLEIRQRGKPDILMITEAGIVGKIGFNSEGIGVSLDALGSDMRPKGETIPLHIALRGVLNSYTLADAIGNASRTPPACCANFMMAAASGQAVNVEIGPGQIDVLYPGADGVITHTNHFFGPRTVNIRDTYAPTIPDTFLRLGRINDLFRELDGKKIAAEDLQEILRDHMGRPDSICRHEDLREPTEKRLQTNFAVIMDLAERSMLYTPGAPCGCGFIPLSLGGGRP